MVLDISQKIIDIKYTQKKIELNSKLQSEVEDYWLFCRGKNPYLTRGEIFCITSFKIGNSISIYLSLTDYAYYLYCINKSMNEKNRFCFAAALIETLDNEYVIGQMNSFTSTPYRYQLPGGAIDKKNVFENIVNLNENLKQELEEEININILNYLQLDKLRPYYMILGDITLPIIYKIHLPLSSNQIKSNYEKICSDKREFLQLIFLKKDSDTIRSFIKKSNSACYLRKILEYEI